MALPFPFERRPFDIWFPGVRQRAHEQSICSDCREPVDYAGLSIMDKLEYRISYLCPACFAACEITPDQEN